MIIEKEFEDAVFQFALENALNYGGKANPKALFGKLMPKFPEMKEDMNLYTNKIENIVNQVNEMSAEEQKLKLLNLNPKYFEKESKEEKENIKEEGLPELPKHKSGEVIVRFAPAPSGYLHIGHAYNIVYNYEYKKKYGGRFILRFEDTNPENIGDNYKQILEDVNWLTDNGVDEIYYQSDRVDIYYKYLRQLIETNYAYVCSCESETFKAYNDSSESCPHRNMKPEDNLQNYNKFFNGEYKDGDACIRFKGDLKNPNPALRDMPIARLNSTPHVRVGTKYKLWPMYNFCTSIDDYLMGINYVIRGKDSEINGVRQDMIKNALGLGKCNFYHIGRTKFEDLELGKTPIKKKIEEGFFTGWDDPRVPTLISFRKRGFKAEAFRNMIIAKGISKRDSKITEKEYFKMINFHNKQILEKEADRFFFINNPKKLIIENVGEFSDKEIIIQKHPDFKDRGYRKFSVNSEYLIDGIDFNNIEVGETIRLMHFANFKIIEKNANEMKVQYLSKDYDKNLELKRNIHYVPAIEEEQRKAEIIMQDGSKLKGLTESLQNPKEGDAIQFERFGFVRFDNTKDDKTRVFYFTHR